MIDHYVKDGLDDPGGETAIGKRCEWCGKSDGLHYYGCVGGYATAMGKRLSDDPGLAEIKRMEYLMSKAPCLARLDELAAYAAKDECCKTCGAPLSSKVKSTCCPLK